MYEWLKGVVDKGKDAMKTFNLDELNTDIPSTDFGPGSCKSEGLKNQRPKVKSLTKSLMLKFKHQSLKMLQISVDEQTF